MRSWVSLPGMKSALLNLALILGSISVCILIGEVILRAKIGKPQSTLLGVTRFDRESGAIENIPNLAGMWKGVYVGISSQGLRDVEYSVLKPRNTYRILFVGDSFTFGTGVSVDSGFVEVLEYLLNVRTDRNGLRYEVLNFGVEGANSLSEARLLRARGLDFQPDLVVVGYFVNDVLSLSESGFRGEIESYVQTNGKTEEDSGGLRSGTPSTYSFQRSIYNIGNRLAKYSYFMDFVGVRFHGLLDKLNIVGGKHAAYWRSSIESNGAGWLESRNCLLEMSEVSRSHDAAFLVTILPALMDLNDNYYFKRCDEKIERFCRTNSIDCLDLFPFFKNKDSGRLAVSLTDSHYNSEGHRIVAQNLYGYIRSRYLQNSQMTSVHDR